MSTRIYIPSIERSGLAFYRTASIGDGKCLLHALLFLLNTQYSTLNDSAKREMVIGFLKEISDNLTMDDWLSFGLGESGVQVSMTLRHIFEKFMTEHELDILFQRVDTNTSVLELAMCLTGLVPAQYHTFVQRIVSSVCEQLFNRYKQSLPGCSDLGVDEVNYVSSKYRVNILVFQLVQGDSAVPFYAMRYNPDYPKTILILNVGGVHWEPIEISAVCML